VRCYDCRKFVKDGLISKEVQSRNIECCEHRSVRIISSVRNIEGRGKQLESVTFKNGSKSERIEASAFTKGGLKSVLISLSVIFLRIEFLQCGQLESVPLETGSKLEWIEEEVIELASGSDDWFG
jgi:hypothetical protein